MSFNSWIKTAVRPNQRILHSNKKKQTITTNNLYGSKGDYAERENGNLKRSHTVWFYSYNIFEMINYIIEMKNQLVVTKGDQRREVGVAR